MCCSRWSQIECTKVFSDRIAYIPRAKEDLRAWCRLCDMSAPPGAPKPVLKFSEIDFGAAINAYVREHFDQPTPIQAQVRGYLRNTTRHNTTQHGTAQHDTTRHDTTRHAMP